MQPATPQDPEDPVGTVVDEAVLAQRRERRAGGDQQPLIDRAAAAERAVAGLEARAEELRGELERATTDRNDAVRRLGDTETALRTARQHGFAEEQQRIDAEADLAGARREADALRGHLDAARARVAELERELRATRGRLEGELAALQELADGLTERLESEGAQRAAAVAYAPTAAAADADGLAELAARVAAAQRRADATASALGAARSRGTRDAEELAAARRTIAALQDSVAALREEGDTLRARTQNELAEVTRERDALAAQVGLIETTVAQLSARFEATRAAMQQRVEQEQEGRQQAEARLDQERLRLADELARERDALRARVAVMLGELDDGLARVRAAPPALLPEVPLLTEVDRELTTAPDWTVPGATPAFPDRAPEPPAFALPAELRAELERLNAALGVAAPAAGTQDVVAGLARAAQRLRAAQPHAAPTAPAPAPALPPASTSAPPAAPASGRGRPAWLASVIADLERDDPLAAADLVLALLPAQAGLLGGSACYEIAVDGAAPVRVTVAGGRADVRPVSARRGEDADFRVAGSPTALAPLVAGGVRWPVRIPVTLRVDGRKRGLRRILRAMRSPVLVGDLRGPQEPVAPGVVLRALCLATEPAWTGGQRSSVAFAVTGGEATWRVDVTDTELRLRTGTKPDPTGAEHPPTATVRGSADGLLGFIAGAPAGSAPGVEIEGDRHAVTFLLGQWDRVQGLPARPA